MRSLGMNVWMLAILLALCGGQSAGAASAADGADGAEPVDRNKARELFQKQRRGEQLTEDERAYLDRARKEMQAGRKPGDGADAPQPKATFGLVPLTELGTEKYKGEDGGLYGGGKNEPPEAHAAAARKELEQIVPRDAEGKPAPDGKTVFVSISMSNATMEFAYFKTVADQDPDKSPRLTIVDCAQGGQAMAEWTDPQAKTWEETDRRLKAAGVTAPQVECAWIKLANKGPSGDLAEHGKKLQSDTEKVLNNARARFPNLRMAYLSSRIYGGYATSRLNPEPYAYESAFAARWLIQDQIKGRAELNCNPARGPVKAPLLLWGPYLWADGTTARKGDELVWKREDLAGDGTHPSESGRKKVSAMLLQFLKTDPLAKGWFGK